MRNYIVCTKDYPADSVKRVVTTANNKRQAYLNVTGQRAYYSAWVEASINNGKSIHYFNTFEGRPY